jgi:hypothetical protein
MHHRIENRQQLAPVRWVAGGTQTLVARPDDGIPARRPHVALESAVRPGARPPQMVRRPRSRLLFNVN